MSEINTRGPAFPVQDPFLLSPMHESDMKRIASGMTLRDYFAAKAMQARLTDYESCKSLLDHAKKSGLAFAEEVAAQAYDMADAMLTQREKSAT